jgi:aldehyde:ferredoxin oxidoreductase
MLPARLFTPLENGPLAGKSISRDDFVRALHTLYNLKDWDIETGIPAAKKLHELDLSWSSGLL